jgi:hypothetical protein
MLRRRPVMRTVARTAVVAGTATVVAGGVRRHQDAKAQQAQAGAQPQAEMAPAPAEGAPVPGSQQAIDQLKEMAQLHEQGILTDEEFAAQKAKLLG